MIECLNHAFGFVCGQNPAHTWAPGGVPLPFCERCTGLYAGASIALLLHICFRPKLTPRCLELHGAFLLTMLPLGFHWLPQGPLLRTASGLLFAAGIVTFLCLRFDHLTRSNPARPTESAGSGQTGLGGYLAGLAVALVMLPLAANRGGALTGNLLALVGAVGALALGALICGTVTALLTDGVHLARRRLKPYARP